ncbi:hypothetical protein F0L74_11790 [Chitinophaga agrisoli]|uniref:Uncharacterized protein n=1 Tax=Chitinophaga agrisoli TaxID=2607653 RepID=A0A5B2VX59_9BACT|nr:hypothetical protein [Chitinophaga agrisoli]KAA2243190.1 hypothetical protein F0L74_11790 [Chitinophaga agrisoli]
MAATTSRKRNTLNSCSTGQIGVTIVDGRRPYTINIDAPAGYTGPTTFVTYNKTYVIDNLSAGSYTVTVTDTCGQGMPPKTIDITEMPPMSQMDIHPFNLLPVPATCNRMEMLSPTLPGDDGASYWQPGTPLTSSMSFDGGDKIPYKPTYSGIRDTLPLPSGLTFKDIYGKKVTVFIKSPCGEEVAIDVPLGFPSLSLSSSNNCNINFDAHYFVTGEIVCPPVFVSFKNNSTGEMKYDTISDLESGTTAGLPFGSYTVTCTSSDGYPVYQNANWIVNAAPNPYRAQANAHSTGPAGNDGAASFFILRNGSNFTANTTIKLLSPSDYFYEGTPSSATSVHPVQVSLPPKSGYFHPGNYVFTVTDGCNTYNVPITVRETDVYRYNWTYDLQPTCNGMAVVRSGTAMYKNNSQPVYFKILSGPPGYSSKIVPIDTPLILPLPGVYTVGMSASPTSVDSFGVNVKTIVYENKTLAVDTIHTFGWVCPSLPDDSGYIRTAAVNGVPPYTFSIIPAELGQNGTPIASNTSGRFSTSASNGSYTLTVDKSYIIKVVDACGAKTTQAIKIIDLITAQVAKSDKPQYCIGENIYLSVINLPTTADTYQWTGPDGFSSTAPAPVVTGVKPSTVGTYHVVINSDICRDPIIDDVEVDLAPFVTDCYSAITDTSVNPYFYGLLGEWRPARSYTYYGTRTAKVSDTQQTDISTDGAFTDFTAFWKNAAGAWSSDPVDTTRWVWNAESTLFNRKGFELENKDPLGRYNAGLYGYDYSVPVAVVQNSRYRESAFEGFEDYFFEPVICDTTCAVGRRFDFSAYKANIDSTQQHTGRYSLRVNAGSSAGISAALVAADTDVSGLNFNTGTGVCADGNIALKSIRADANAILPGFLPIPGKEILVSAWVKEAQDCNCQSYTGSQVSLTVENGGGNIIVNAKPIGGIIDGWQRVEGVIAVPASATRISVNLVSTGSSIVYFDDVRVHPYNANMKSFVYNAINLRLMAELDENNYATFYEYDDDGTLIRLKKETERGIKTIKETRSALLKEQ